MRAFAALLCLSVLVASLPAPACADPGDSRTQAAMTDEEDAALAARAAQTPDLERFEAGSALGIVVGVLLVVALVLVIVHLLDHH